MTSVLIFNDVAQIAWSRSIGAYRVATSCRKAGYTTQVVEHFLWAALTQPQRIYDSIDRFVTADTKVVGFSITFFQQSLLAPESSKVQRMGHKLDRSVVFEDKLPYLVPLKGDFMEGLRERIKRRAPNCKIIVGGATKIKMDLTQTIFDAQIMGFADRSMVAYLQYLDGRNPFFQLNGGYINYDMSAPGFDVDEAVTEWQEQDLMIPGERIPIEISRGCIFKCKFCGYALNGKRKLDYLKSLDVLEAEVRRNHDLWGIKDYWFSDDTYNDSKEKVLGVHQMTKRLDFKMSYRAYLRLDLLYAHQDTIEPLMESGLDNAMFGIESLNGDNTKLVGKGIPTDRALNMLDRLWTEWDWKTNVFVLTCLMVGLPHDSDDNMGWLDTVFSDDFKTDWVNLNPLYLSAQPSDHNSSEFDREYKKYGYEFTDGRWEWLNTKTGMTFTGAQKIVQEALAKNRVKNRLGTMQEYHMGMSKQEMYAKASTIFDLSKFDERWRVFDFLYRERLRLMDDYFNRLMNL